MKTVIVSLGGSMIVPEHIDHSFLSAFRDMILRLEDTRVIIVCGGGKTARNYVEAAKKIVATKDTDLDWIGIAATCINAELVRSIFLEHAYEHVITNPHEKITTDKRIIIGAGYEPGCSSDLDAVILAEQFEASELTNISNIDHVYDKDPSQHSDAKPLNTITWENFQKLVGETWTPSMNTPFDPIATKEAKRLGLKVNIINGKDLKNISACLKGDSFVGTTIHP